MTANSRYSQVNWNETQLHYTRKAPKRAYYLSLEFLMGRTLDNALLNLGLKDRYKDGIDKLGFNIENILDKGNILGHYHDFLSPVIYHPI